MACTSFFCIRRPCKRPFSLPTSVLKASCKYCSPYVQVMTCFIQKFGSKFHALWINVQVMLPSTWQKDIPVRWRSECTTIIIKNYLLQSTNCIISPSNNLFTLPHRGRNRVVTAWYNVWGFFSDSHLQQAGDVSTAKDIHQFMFDNHSNYLTLWPSLPRISKCFTNINEFSLWSWLKSPLSPNSKQRMRIRNHKTTPIQNSIGRVTNRT